MEGQKKTAVLKVFEYLENEEYEQAKSMLNNVYAEIKCLQQESLHPTANEALKKLDSLLKNIECGQRNIIFGKWLTVKAAFVGHLEERLKAITEREPNARIPAADTRQSEIKSNQDEKELQIERSKRASKLSNPDIADLSNVNCSTTKIAERFSELYNNEWTEAFKTLTRSRILREVDSIKILFNIVEEAYTFCEQEYPTADKVEEKKQIELLQSKFCDKTLRENHQLNSAEVRRNIDSFAKRCVELCWLMWTHSPPVYLVPTTRDYFDQNLYRAYTRSGSIPDFFVWPALKLYKEGELLAKGVVHNK